MDMLDFDSNRYADQQRSKGTVGIYIEKGSLALKSNLPLKLWGNDEYNHYSNTPP